MQQRTKKALMVSSLIGLISAIPLFYLAYLYKTQVEVDVEGMGVVPDFAYTFMNNPIGITHHDTEQYPMVVAILKDACDQEEEQQVSESCELMLSQMRTVEEWMTQHITVGQPHVANPRKLRLIAMAEGRLPEVSDNWSLAQIRPGQPYLVPENRKDAEYPAFVLIDDASFFRGYIPSSSPNALEKVRREVTRIVSHQYLMHYVTQQTLMWEKARGRAGKDKSH